MSEERAIIDIAAERFGRELTEGEARLQLRLARQIGELPFDPVEGCGYRVD